MSASKPPKTPDGRYILVKGRLWRCTDPDLTEQERQHWVRHLMKARSAVGKAKRDECQKAEQKPRVKVEEAKRALGERGPVWWSDGAPDYSQCKVENTPYAGWYADLKQS